MFSVFFQIFDFFQKVTDVHEMIKNRINRKTCRVKMLENAFKNSAEQKRNNHSWNYQKIK